MAVVIQGTQTSTSSVTMNTRPHGRSDLIIQRRGTNVVPHEVSHDYFTIQGQNFQPNDPSIGSGCTEITEWQNDPMCNIPRHHHLIG